MHEWEVIGRYELRIVKGATGPGDGFAAAWAAMGVAVAALTDGGWGWGLDTTRPRWLLQVRGGAIGEVQTVRTRFTAFGTRRAAREIRELLAVNDVDAIDALPNLNPGTGF